MKKLTYILICFPKLLLAQEVNITLDSSSKNHVITKQVGVDTTAKTNLKLRKSDSNYVETTQLDSSKKGEKKIERKKDSIWDKFSDINKFFILLISILTVIGLLWKGFPYAKKMFRKK